MIRNIVSVNTADVGGGAERVALDLHRGFRECGYTSWLVVGDKRTSDSQVLSFYQSPHIDYRPYADEELQRTLARQRAEDEAGGHEDFNHPYSRLITSITGSRPDVVLCHNLHGGYFDLRALEALSAQVPVFLFLHDTWMFTGHCAYPFECVRWASGCGDCPRLDTPPAIKVDGSRYNWDRKKSIFKASSLHVAAPTTWLHDHIARSVLAPAVRSSRVIPCPIDTRIFHPAPRDDARRDLGLPVDARILVFAANRTLSNPFKDYATIDAAIQMLGKRDLGHVLFLGIGEEAPTKRIGCAELRYLPFLPTDRVARYLQAADVYVHAAKQENFGLITAEAQACGTPVVATDVGGIAEVVGHGSRGLLVPKANAQSMADAIGRLLLDGTLRMNLGLEAAAYAKKHWARELILRTFLDWFEEAVR